MIMSLILKLSHMLLPFINGPIIASIIVVKVLKLNIKWPFGLVRLA